MANSAQRSVPVFGYASGGNGLGLDASAILQGLRGNATPGMPAQPALGAHNPHQTGLGFDSPTSQAFGHNPSLSRAFETGDAESGQWWLEGGPSLYGSSHVGIANTISEALGLGRFSDTLGGMLGTRPKQYSTREWGTSEQNRGNAGSFNYGTYGTLNPDVGAAYENASQADLDWIGHSFDIDGDGAISQPEYNQWHWQTYGEKEGRTIDPIQTLSDILQVGQPTPVPGTPVAQTPQGPAAPVMPAVRAAPMRQMGDPRGNILRMLQAVGAG